MNISPVKFSVSRVQRNEIMQNNKINAQTNSINFGYDPLRYIPFEIRRMAKDCNVFYAIWRDYSWFPYLSNSYQLYSRPCISVQAYDEVTADKFLNFVNDKCRTKLETQKQKIQEIIRAQNFNSVKELVIRPDRVWLLDEASYEVLGTDLKYTFPYSLKEFPNSLYYAIDRLYKFVSNKQ